MNLLAKYTVSVCQYESIIKTNCFTGEHSWILTEPDLGVEIPISHTGCQAHGTLIQSAVPGQFYLSSTVIKMIDFSVYSCI